MKQYGWAAFEAMTLDEALMLLPQIKERTFIEYRMQLAIVQNPHMEKPEELWKLLDPDRDYLDDELDKTGMERLKTVVTQGKGFQIK